MSVTPRATRMDVLDVAPGATLPESPQGAAGCHTTIQGMVAECVVWQPSRMPGQPAAPSAQRPLRPCGTRPEPLTSHACQQPRGAAEQSCMRDVPAGRHVYLGYGGTDTTKLRSLSALTVLQTEAGGGMNATLGMQLARSQGGASGLPARVMSALACLPGGRAFMFGGLQVSQAPSGARKSVPMGGLYELSLSGSAGSGYDAAVQQHAAPGGPTARHGHAAAFVPSLPGMEGGAVFVYGGSSAPELDLVQLDFFTNATRVSADILADGWLFDLGAKRWRRLQAVGQQPPPMYWHQMAVYEQQVRQTSAAELASHSFQPGL